MSSGDLHAPRSFTEACVASKTLTADIFDFEMATVADFDEIAALVSNHFRGPLLEALDALTEDLETIVPHLLEHVLKYPLSLAVRNHEKKIIAVQLASVLKRSDNPQHYEMVSNM